MPPKKPPAQKSTPLYKRRDIIIARLNKFEQYLNQIDPDDLKFGELNARIDKVRQTWDDFDSVQSEIQLSIDDFDTNESEQLVRDDFESRYFELIGRGEELLSAARRSSSPSRSLLDPHSSPHPFASEDVRLPPLSLPTFAGEFDQWVSFRSMFNELVHENRRYQDSIKLKYLKNSLRGEAYSLVESLELTAKNYTVALQMLKERYENPTRAVLKHVREFFDIPKLDKQTASGIRSLKDASQKHMHALKALGQPTDSWDTLVTHLISTKLDPTTFKEWQKHIPSQELPTVRLLVEFMEHQCQILDAVDSQSKMSSSRITNNSNSTNKPQNSKNSSRCLVVENASKQTCVLCEEPHSLTRCSQFGGMTVDERFSFVKSKQLCINCLNKSHRVAECKSEFRCKSCNKSHHSLLHRAQPAADSTSPPSLVKSSSLNIVQNQPQSQPSDPVTHTSVVSQPSVVLLSTANILLHGPDGKHTSCRALLDCGSQSSFLTSSACDRVGLPKRNIRMSVSGFVSSSHPVSHYVEAKISSQVSNFSRQVDFLIVPKITDYIPRINFDIKNLFLPPNIVLADSKFQDQSEIEILIGADIFWELIGHGQFNLPHFALTLRETKLGWIFAGTSTVALSSHCHLLTDVTLESLDKSIRKFWELEKFSPSDSTSLKFSPEEKKCEEHFKSTVSRSPEGRYIVTIPLKNDVSLLGESRDIAIRRFHGLERRFAHDADLKLRYQKFIDEYISLGHCSEINLSDLRDSKVYFVPHHPVFKESSTTTKMRVVFDFSCKTSSGYSLNDISAVGATIQPSLYSHLLRARTYPILICGDIEKMYRQILLDPSQTQLQLIVWRNSPEEPLKTFRLETVSYGNSSASWLSARTLRQLALDHPNPRSSEILQNHFYVDDLITGCDDVTDAQSIRSDMLEHLSRGGFNIRKWSSNSNDFMDTIPVDEREVQSSISFDDSCVRTLGMIWIPSEDCFAFSFDQVQFEGSEETITKRYLYSSISKLFDPIGLLGPVITKAKILMQDLWRQEYDWDEPISLALSKKWKIFGRSMASLKELRIPRRLTIENYSRVEIHGFSDASTVAYGACIYLRSFAQNGNDSHVFTRMVTSRSRVAPLKTQSLPRLELLAAVLLIDLMELVIPSLANIKIDEIVYWTDSRVVLSWINGSPSKWNTFVANRVSRIQEFSHPNQWNHVPTQFNPADHISRGLYADQIVDNVLWWSGPYWLSENRDFKNIGCFEAVPEEELPDVRKTKINVHVSHVLDQPHFSKILTSCSSFDKLVRVIAYCYRFLSIPRYPKGSRRTGPILAQEFIKAKLTVLRLTQNIMFPQEFSALKSGKNVKESSVLSSLNPFLDSDQLIRVGGRLQESSLTPDKKYPIVLIHGGTEPINKFTFILARQIHERNFHVGPQSLLSMIREQFWPINGRNLARKVYHQCIVCRKANPKPLDQGMGNLPKPRVEPARPFFHCGLDYAGPILIRSSSLRNSPRRKSYISLFICMSTKAIHVQLVEDLSTNSFIAALKCFISRRGKPHTIYCDNATNFVGAKNQLKELYDLWSSETHKNTIVNFLSADCINWKFIPPRSPNFGGLWESGVKLVKNHLQKIVGSRVLTFNELYTVLTQIESCLNSRPLFPMSSDPNDLSSLTPAHFLIGGSLVALPEPCLMDEPSNRLARWQLVQQMVQHFWSRWSSEYLQELQRRAKWKTNSANIACGTLVMIKNDQAPVSSWTLGRVVQIHPGPDGIVRVVTLRTPSGFYKRNVRLLCPLPINEDSNDSSLKTYLQGGELMDTPTTQNSAPIGQ